MSLRHRRRTKKLTHSNKLKTHKQNLNSKSNQTSKQKRQKWTKFKCAKCDCKRIDCQHCKNELLKSCKQYIINNLYNPCPYRLRNFHFMIDLVLFVFGALYVVLVPYTKVEESFNMQATHDMLFHGYTDLTQYDHYAYPGVVPRTFVGAFILSLMVYPWKFIITYVLPLIFGYFVTIETIHLQQQCQYLIRFALLFVNVIALSKFRQSFIAHYFNTQHITESKHKISHKIAIIQQFSLLFALLILAQFHFLFYASRLLPNCLALPCVTIAFAKYFGKNYKMSLVWLALSTIIFRCDTMVIAVPFIAVILIFKIERKINTLFQFVMYGLIGSVACIIMTVVVDSWFWTGFETLKWPEFEVFWYNTYNNQSSHWGVSPWTHYFFPLLPKLLFANTLFMCFSIFKIYPMLFIYEWRNTHKTKDFNLWNLFSLFIDWESVHLLLVCAVFIALYSFLPHKEIRFIFFIIPPCTLLSTIGCIRLLTLWGFIGFNAANVNYSLLWFKHNLYQRQTQFYYLWIPNNSFISCMVKKLLSFDTTHALSLVSFKRYFKVVCKDIPKSVSKLKPNILSLFVTVLIIFSILLSWYAVYESSYNYPGGVAITLFPQIVHNYKANIVIYGMNNRKETNTFEQKQQIETENNLYITPQRTVHSKRGHKMDRDYQTIMNASVTEEGKSDNIEIFAMDDSSIGNTVEEMDIFEDINCVHIGNLAAQSGVTRFMTPSFYSQFRFAKIEQIGMEQYASVRDPCNLLQEIYDSLCGNINTQNRNDNNKEWSDDIYDEEYFQKNDDYLNENKDTDMDCYSSMEYKYSMAIKGFDYLISEYASVPGYYLIPNGVIYAKSLKTNLMKYVMSMFVNLNNTTEQRRFLEPTLYVLKRKD